MLLDCMSVSYVEPRRYTNRRRRVGRGGGWEMEREGIQVETIGLVYEWEGRKR